MRGKLYQFMMVGAISTLVDVGLFVLLGGARYGPEWFNYQPGGSWLNSLALVDLVGLSCASVVSYGFHRKITFRANPEARWVSSPDLFIATALISGLVDILALYILDYAQVWLLPGKCLAVGCAATVRWLVYRYILWSQVRTEMGTRVARPEISADYRLCVVLPAFNEGRRIGDTVEALQGFLATVMDPAGLELLVVDDGSTDDTCEQAQRAGARVLRLESNGGKGAAVRAGVLACRAETVVFTDADMAYSPAAVWQVAQLVEQGWDMVVGSRRLDRSWAETKVRWIRRFGGDLVNMFTHFVLLGNFRDTQCGLKGFRSDVGRVVFERTKIDRFAFDVELFLIAEQDQLSLCEVPVCVHNRLESSVSLFFDSFVLLADLFRIRRWAGQGAYVLSAAQSELLAQRANPQ